MANAYLGAVPIKGVKRTSFAPIPWAPPGQESLFNKKRMGQKRLVGSFSPSALPTSLGVSLGSVAAIMIGMKAPSPIGEILIGAGFAGLGYSIYNLFSGAEKRDLSDKTVPLNLASKEAFDQITGAFRKPRMYEKIDHLGPDNIEYNWEDVDIEFVVTNPSNEDVDLTLRFTQTETANKGWFGSSKDTATYFKRVSVPSGKSATVPFEIDTLNWFGGLTETIVADKMFDVNPKSAGVKLAEVTFFP